MADLSTYEGRQAARDAATAAGQHVVVDAGGIYNQDTGQTTSGGSSGGGSMGGGGGGATAAPSGALDQSLQKMLAALASGNAQAFQQSKDEFNKNYELALAQVTGTYQGNPTAAVQQFNQQLAQSASQFAQTFGLQQQGQAQTNAATVAALTGYYNAPGSAGGGGGGSDTQASVQQLLAQNPNLADPAYQQVLKNSRGWVFWPGENLDASGRPTTGTYPGFTPTGGGAQAQSGQGQQTLAGQLQQANLSGQYNGAPTEQARQFNQQQGQQNNQFNASLGQSLLQAATQLRGPQDYLQYQNYTHGGQSLLSQLYGNGQAGASQPTGQLQSANLNNAIGDLGAGRALTGTGAAIPQQGAGAGSQPDPTTQALLASFGLTPGGTLSPGQIDPARWDSIGQVGQDLTKNLASTYFGYDPNDFVNQINATRPQGAASRTTATAYAKPTGLF